MKRSQLALSLLLCVPASGQESGEAHEHPAPPSRDASALVGAVRVRASLSNGFYTTAAPDRLVLKVDLTAVSPASKRPPLNLALVMDRSGSMADKGKFEYAIDAARLVVGNLSDRDVVSLIAFNEQAVVISPAGRAVNKRFLTHRLHELGPTGFTNLSAGLLEAFAQIDASAAEGQTKRVIVLTDGLANRGIIDSDKLRRLVAAAHKRKIGISTLGVGTEFDGTLLKAMAEAGGGRYTYVKAPDQIPGAVSRELAGLLAVVAQNVKLEVRADSNTRVARIQGQPVKGAPPSVPFGIGDIRTGERGIFLVDLAPQLFAKGQTAGASVVLTLDRPDTGRRERKTLHVVASFTRETAQVQKSEDQGIHLYAKILSVVEKAEDAVLGLDIDGFREATTLFSRYHEQVRRHALRTRDQMLLNQAFMLKHFMAELDAARRSGLLHGHGEAAAALKKTIEYRRYLRQHHRPRIE